MSFPSRGRPRTVSMALGGLMLGGGDSSKRTGVGARPRSVGMDLVEKALGASFYKANIALIPKPDTMKQNRKI